MSTIEPPSAEQKDCDRAQNAIVCGVLDAATWAHFRVCCACKLLYDLAKASEVHLKSELCSERNRR